MLLCKTSALGLWILVSLLGCCIGYITVKRSAKYHHCHGRRYEHQRQNTNVDSRDYHPSHYSSNYYPSDAGVHQPDLKPDKPDHNLCPSSFEEGQKLLQVYRLIRVIVLFRIPTKKHSNSLEQLVKRLTKLSLQNQLVELVYHVDGYEEVAALGQDHHGPDLDVFVDDSSRLLLVIQNALNALDLDDGGHNFNYPQHRFSQDHRHKEQRCCEVHKELCEELRQLRDLANAFIVSIINKEIMYEAKPQVKESDLSYFNNLGQNMIHANNAENEQKSRNYQFDELDELIIGLELMLQQQMMIAKAMQFKEQTQDIPTPISPPTNALATLVPSVASQDIGHESWLGSYFATGNLLPDHQMIDPVKKESRNQDEQIRQEAEDIFAEDATEGSDEEARELPLDEEQLQLLKEQADEPSRLNLLADLVNQKETELMTYPISIKPRQKLL